MDDLISRETIAIKRDVLGYGYYDQENFDEAAFAKSMLNEIGCRLADKICEGGSYMVEMCEPSYEFDNTKVSATYKVGINVNKVVKCKDCARVPSFRDNLLATRYCTKIGNLVAANNYCFMGIRRKNDE